MKISYLSLFQKIVLSLILMLTTAFSFAETDKNLSFSVTEVAPGLYFLKGVGGFTGGNIALSVGEDGVVMIDDSFPPMLDIMKTAIGTVTDKPVDFLINTHFHFDHAGNNETFGNDGTWIVAHKNMRKLMTEKGIHTQQGVVPAPKAALPVITFARFMNFHLNGQHARIFHVPHAHTNGDAIIHYKNANVIHTGDVMFNGMFPYIDLGNGGSVDGYIKAQKKILALSNAETKIIPGHGPLANRQDLQDSIAMLEDSRKLIADLIADGKTEQQVLALNPLAKYHDSLSWVFISTEKMTQQFYRSLTTKKHNTKHQHKAGHKNKSEHKH